MRKRVLMSHGPMAGPGDGKDVNEWLIEMEQKRKVWDDEGSGVIYE